MDAKLFHSNPRDFALQLVADQLVSADHLLLCALKHMSNDDVRDMLDCNELSPRFDEDDEPDEPLRPIGPCEDAGVYVSWDANGNPMITAQSFGRDSRWFESRDEAEAAIDEYNSKHAVTDHDCPICRMIEDACDAEDELDG